MTLCIHATVSGKVQGVWFRASTQQEAERYGLTGWVRNLPDGRVEVLACGEKEKIARFCEWLKKGPSQAEVSDFSCEEVLWEEHAEFEVL